MLNIAVLVSGGGTNLQALINAQNRGELQNGKLSLVIASRPDAFALQRAEQAGLQTAVLQRKTYKTQDNYDDALIELLAHNRIDLVVLAGFMTIISNRVIAAYPGRIMNIHPSLIPAFCGEGYYGLRVHQSALERGVKVTGATVHFVNEICDGGPIILQKTVLVQANDTPETLQKRVMEQAEWKILPQAVALFCMHKLKITGNTVEIAE